jgi:Fe-S-cluster containining protein
MTMTMLLKIRTANRRRPITRLAPATLICLLAIFLLEQEAFVAEAFHTSSSTRSSTLRKSKFGISRRSSFISTNLREAGDDDDDDSSSNSNYNDEIALTRFLQKARDRALDAFAQQIAPSWMSRSDTETLPFSCTGCGKCCKTTGSVYMSPAEYNKAADYLNVTTDAFVQEYASHTLAAVPAPSTVSVVSVPVSEDNLAAATTDTVTATTAAILAAAAEPWICIKDQTSESVDADGPACIFLDRTTNHCQIYPVRPVQCRTYPFWPTVTASVQSWNAECRRLEATTNDGNSDSDSVMDSVGDSDAFDSSLLPRWTPDIGGCEGMRLVAVEESPAASIGEDDSATNTTSTDPQHLSESVPRQTALELLYEYVVEERRFPHEAKEVPVSSE